MCPFHLAGFSDIEMLIPVLKMVRKLEPDVIFAHTLYTFHHSVTVLGHWNPGKNEARRVARYRNVKCKVADSIFQGDVSPFPVFNLGIMMLCTL